MYVCLYTRDNQSAYHLKVLLLFKDTQRNSYLQRISLTIFKIPPPPLCTLIAFPQIQTGTQRQNP